MRHLLMIMLCAPWFMAIQASDLSAMCTSRAGWVVAPEGDDQLGLVVTAQSAWTGIARLEVCDAAGRVQQSFELPATVPAAGQATLQQPVSWRGRPLGEYLIRWRLLHGPKDDRQQDAGYERSLMVAGPQHAFILLDREPIARGLELVRKDVQPVEIITGGLKRWVWKSTFGSATQGWWRSHRFQVTDPAFQRGAAPVVDVETWSVHRSDAPLNLAADTRAGGIVVNGWGGRGTGYNEDPPWKQLVARLDDAQFAGGKTGAKPEDNTADTCDLRYNACTADGELRSLVLTRYDLVNQPQWQRLLRLQGVDCGKDRYVFQPGTSITARIALANRARVAYKAEAQVSFTTDLGRELWQRTVPIDIAAESTGAIPITIATNGLPYGIYILRTRIGDHLSTETMLALSDEAPLPKAKAGEFLYGTDLGGSWRDTRKFDWADFMGFDIIRNLARSEGDSLEDVDQAITALQQRGLRGTIMMGPAWDADAAKRSEAWRRQADFIGQVAKKHGDFLRWYELGNEPDLTFFYAGSTDAYVEGYLALRAAIKANDPESVVMNGGLCFHSDEGWRRAHEIVAKIPADQIDAWAYHGHGPGVGAERNAWQRQDTAVRAVGKGDRDYIETESGLAASDAPAKRRQAQTIVEKMVFAQSVKAPLFLWFNLHMDGGEWYYTTIEREREPRPAVLAHRTMVKALRGLAHVGTLDLLAAQAEAHVFAGADGRRAVVLWSDRGELTRTVAIGKGCSQVQRIDLFGNSSALAEAAPGLLQVTADADPVFITWTTSDPAFVVALPPPPLLAPDRLLVVPGRPAAITVTVRNPGNTGLQVDLMAEVTGEAPVKLPKAKQSFAVPGAVSMPLSVPLMVAAVQPSAWPRQWSVFAPVPGDIDLATFTDLPARLTARGKDLLPLPGIPRALDLDLGRLAGGHLERKQALCFAYLESDRAQTVEFGAGADWWMEWWVNGKRVYSTMNDGNQGPYQVLSHVFKVDLKKGRNLIAVKVLSGSGGWRLVAGGPDEVAAARRERTGVRDAIRLDLLVDGKPLARQSVPIEVLRPVVRGSGALRWLELGVDGELGNVNNVHAAQPDSRLWYQGPDDLSGRVWLRDDGTNLRVAVAVTDDVPKPGDHVVLRLAAGTTLGTPFTVPCTSRRDEEAKLTWYEVSIPRARVGSERFAIQVVVHDDDWGAAKQTTAWGEGDDPEQWFQAWLQ